MTSQSCLSASEQPTPIFWPTMIVHVFLLIGALFGFFTFSWSNLAIAAVRYWVAICLVGTCYHYLLVRNRKQHAVEFGEIFK